MVVKYRMFTSSDEFEKWQESEKVQIFTVQPLISGMKLNLAGTNEAMAGGAGADIAVFVTYAQAA